MADTDVAIYLGGLDAHLATLAPAAALAAIEGERERVERAERELARWCVKGAGMRRSHAPTRFTAIELALLDGELSIRAARIREHGGVA